MIVDRQSLAAALDLTPNRIQQLTVQGMPKVARGRYDLAACTQWYIAFKLNGAQESSDVNEARKKLYDAQVIKTELETERMRRELIPADEVLRDMNAFQQIVVDTLDGWPERTAQQLVDIIDATAVEEALLVETNAVRDQVAAGLDSYVAEVGE